MSDKNKDGDFYRRPDKVRLWNSEKGELLGRNKESWGESSDMMEVNENSLVKILSKINRRQSHSEYVTVSARVECDIRSISEIETRKKSTHKQWDVI